MIENDKQLEITLSVIREFALAVNKIADVNKIGNTTNDKLKYLSRLASLVGELDQLRSQVSEYLQR